MSNRTEELIPRWHRELELFGGIKPLLILEGNVLDQYRYPIDGSVGQDEIIPLSRYLHAYFSDNGYAEIVFPYLPAFDGFMVPEDSESDDGMIGIPEASSPKLTREAKSNSAGI